MDGWLRTGDVATIDPQGRLRVVDRVKDLIKSGGEWISSLALEAALLEVPGVADVAVPHERWQERPVAVVVPDAGGIDPAAVLADLEGSVGKVDKRRLRDWLGETHNPAAADASRARWARS